MKGVVIYDFGVNRGGGDFVMFNILQALSGAGYDVSLVTSNPSGLNEAVRFFGKDIPNVEIESIKLPRFIRHPYSIAYVARKAGERKHDFYVFSDDVPKCMIGKRVICYVHYPHAARFKFSEYIAKKYSQTLSGRVMWWIHERIFTRSYPLDRIPNNWLLLANSKVTRDHLCKTFNLNQERVPILNPPVASASITSDLKNGDARKEDLVLCIGRFEPEKRFEDVILALRGNARLSMMGFSYDRAYLNKLTRMIRDLGLKDRVELLVDAERSVVLDRLLRAKALVHPTLHEPFGIAVVEGMAAGCIPIVKKGFNGPWLEITQEGRYGLGFSSTEELASVVEGAIERYESFDIEGLTSRALEFDEAEFRHKFLRIVENF